MFSMSRSVRYGWPIVSEKQFRPCAEAGLLIVATVPYSDLSLWAGTLVPVCLHAQVDEAYDSQKWKY